LNGHDEVDMNGAVLWVLGSLALLLGAGCADPADDDTTGYPCDDDTAVPDDDACGDDDSEGSLEALADQARLVVLSASDTFIGGPGASAREGDYLLHNNYTRYVIRAPRDGNFHVGVAGALIDADLARFSEQADRDAIHEVVTMLGPGRVFVAESFEVVNDGSHTGDVVELVATGTDAPLPLLTGVTGEQYESLGLQVEQTYLLTPYHPWLEVRTKVVNSTGHPVEVTVADLVWFDRDAYQLFVAGTGFVDEPQGQQQTMLGLQSRRADHAFAIFDYEEHVVIDSVAELDDHYAHLQARRPTWVLSPGTQGQAVRGMGVDTDLAILDSHRRSRWGYGGIGWIEGRARFTGSNRGIGGTRLFLVDAAGDPHMAAIAGSFGFFKIQADLGDWNLVAVTEGNNEDFDFPGRFGTYGAYAQPDRNELALRAFEEPDSVLAVPFADGYLRGEAAPITVVEDRIWQEFVYDPPATLSLRVEDEDGLPIPAVVRIDVVGADPQPLDERLGESRPADGSRKVVWLLDGEAEVLIVPGTYDVTAHRGFRHELARAEELELLSDQSTEVSLVLPLAHETPGFVSADLDTHAALSVGGRCSIEERLAAAAASDVQVLVATERDHVVDYSEIVAAMGLGDVLVAVPGQEVATPQNGRFAAYPLQPDSGAPAGGAVRWWEVEGDTEDLIEVLRSSADVLVQVNAGRAADGMFETAHYNPHSYNVAHPERFTSDFDVIELLNGQHAGDVAPLLQDWCSFLDQGARPTAVGASDSHGRLDGTGAARTYVAVDSGDIGALDLDELFDSLRQGRAVVSGGPFVLVQAEAPGGETAAVGETLQAGTATLHVEVMAPSWMDLDTVRVYTNGCQLVGSFPVGTSAPPVRFETDLSIGSGTDAYFFVEVEGSDPMDPVSPDATPYALTNPIFLEP